MTSTSNKILVSFLFALAFVSTVSASHYYGDSSGSSIGSSDTSFSIPNYDSHREIAFNLVAPFLLIFLVIQLGLQKALFFTFADDQVYGQELSDERNKIKKYSVVMALVISGMIIPSPLFRWFNDWVAVIFGGATYIIVAAFFIAAVVFLWRRF